MSIGSFPGTMHVQTWQEAIALDIRQIEIDYDQNWGILWLRMRHPERACFTPELMRDMRRVQLRLKELFGGIRDPRDLPFQWLVWASDAPRAWSLGGDLSTFCRFIREGDRAGLQAYAELAVEILHDNYRSLDLPIMTTALVEGDALGGGFEAILTDDLVVAERGAKFGLPEILFNMFPGMGASSLLIRKLGSAAATRLILSGQSWTAEEAEQAGAVSLIAEPGTAKATLLRYIDTHRARLPGEIALHQSRRRAEGLGLDEMLDVVRIWTELTLGLGEDSLRRMQALARVQERKRGAA
jgi:DSF synthase